MDLSEWEGTAWAGEAVPVHARVVDGSLEDLFTRRFGSRLQPWRIASIQDALAVPSLQRCVTLIANTTGALVVQTFRNAALMASIPAVVARPDPYSTPRDFYRDTAYNLATRGEFVWWIARRDFDGNPIALIVVPLNELQVEENPDTRRRMLPIVTWGSVTSTWYSPAHPNGEFVHGTYLKEPGELRGKGPLQMAQAAVSVSVEAQEWAANFYSGGGDPSILIKHASTLDPTADENGYNEADRLRNQFMEKAHNTPRVIDQNIEDVKYLSPGEGGGQALQSRDFQTGEAARMYGMPGALLEYGVPGASLTYQNLADVWVNFVRGCLAPNYLEGIEQAMSDILSRSTTARFLTGGLMRADPMTRWNIYKLAVDVLGPDAAADLARVGEDLAPGNPEVAPVPAAPPAAIPSSFPQMRTAELEVRCDGQRTRRDSGVARLVPCGKLLSTTGVFVGRCPRCHKDHSVAA